MNKEKTIPMKRSRGRNRPNALHSRVRSVGLAVVCLLCAPTIALAQLNNGVPKQVEGVDVEQRLGESLPLEVPVVDSMGRKVAFGSFFDGKRPVIVTLNYSDCPVLCSVQLNQLTQSLNKLDLELGADYQVVTLSIDPQETTERIAETKTLYVEQLTEQPNAAEAWHFVTASSEVIGQVTDALGFRYKYDKQTGEYYHPAMLAFVSPEGVISRYSLKVDFPADQVKLALMESADGKIGSPVDKFLMWCFSYDPDRGQYTAEAWKLMRLGGLVTVAALLIGITPYWLGRRNGPADTAQDEDEKLEV